MKIQTQKDDRRSIFRIIYIFLGLFVLMIGYFVYFMIAQSGEVINNSYNKRQTVLAKKVIRGEIKSSDDKILAKTIVNSSGKETREYPYRGVFANVVGRYSKGISGIEQSENIRLLTSSTNSIDRMYNEFIGKKSLGDNVITTLDTGLQQIAYDSLGSNRGAVVVMEPNTGKILAMVSKPSYDPNKVDEQWKALTKDDATESVLLNRASQGLYPPGSTFKLLTTLAFMRQNPNYRNYKYTCNGSIGYQGMVIHCYHNKVHGKVDLSESLAKSCNTSYANIGKSLDITSLRALCENFLFNKKLPFDLESSISTFQLDKDSYNVKEAMQTAIGQGRTLITPLHNAMIVSAIANGGTMMKPYLVDHIENADRSVVKHYYPSVYDKPMTIGEAGMLAGMMREVVTQGTATGLSGLKVKVAGKTGSADNDKGKAHAWFVGYAPYNNPKISVSIIVENAGTGSDFAVPIARKIITAYFNREK